MTTELKAFCRHCHYPIWKPVPKNPEHRADWLHLPEDVRFCPLEAEPVEDVFDLDQILIALPPGAGFRGDLIAEPHFHANPEVCPVLRFAGFNVGIPYQACLDHISLHRDELASKPVRIFGHIMRCTGWSAKIAPVEPLRSVDRLIWLKFLMDDLYEPGRYYSNLNCLPGAPLEDGTAWARRLGLRSVAS